MSCIIFIKNVNFKQKMLELFEIAFGLFIALIPVAIVFNFFYAIFFRFVPFEIPLIRKRCKSCNSKDISFLGSQDTISYRNTTSSGAPDKRYKNNKRVHTTHSFKCNGCSINFTSPTSSAKVGIMFFLLNKFLFPHLPKSPFTS